MIAHQAVGVDDYGKTFSCNGQVFEKLFPVPVIFKYILLVIASVDHVIKGVRVFYAQRPCHLFAFSLKDKKLLFHIGRIEKAELCIDISFRLRSSSYDGTRQLNIFY